MIRRIRVQFGPHSPAGLLALTCDASLGYGGGVLLQVEMNVTERVSMRVLFAKAIGGSFFLAVIL
jgi:hypothetical protein